MTIDFKEEEISQWERSTGKPYIGYFSPNGELINYNVKIGGRHHENWDNPVSWDYLWFVSYALKETDANDLKKFGNDYYQLGSQPNIAEEIIRGYSIDPDINSYLNIDDFYKALNNETDKIKTNVKNYHSESSPIFYDDDFRRNHAYRKFQLDILDFFQKAYSNNEFFNAIQRKIMVNKRTSSKFEDVDKLNFQYKRYVVEELMSHFKDISVQYLGYDSLERFTTSNKVIKIEPENIENYESYLLSNPRKITTSCLNPNERFFNFLAMDYEVTVLPRYFFNEKTRRFETHPLLEFYQTDKEKILKKELQSIKRLVPLDKRYQYFR